MMFISFLFVILTAVPQAPRGPAPPANPSLSGDPWTRQMENRMSILLEEQERQIMLNGDPPPVTDRHELSILLDLETNLKKLQQSHDALARNESSAGIYKDVEKACGSLITGIRWAVDGVKPEKVNTAPKASKEDLSGWLKSVTPKLDSVIRARKRRLVNFEITQVVLNQLLLIQNLAKELARRPI